MVASPERQPPAQALGRERLAYRPTEIVEQAAQPRAALIVTREPDPPANNRLGVVGRAAHRADGAGSGGSAGRSSGRSCGSSRGTGSSSGSIVYTRRGFPISTFNPLSRKVAAGESPTSTAIHGLHHEPLPPKADTAATTHAGRRHLAIVLLPRLSSIKNSTHTALCSDTVSTEKKSTAREVCKRLPHSHTGSADQLVHAS
jgi:hypothetical protein